MIARLARIEAQPHRVDHVRRALEQMVRDSRSEDPTLGGYVLYKSDQPGEFLIEQHVDAVDEELDRLCEERLMELGTALREELAGPIEVARYRLVVDAKG